MDRHDRPSTAKDTEPGETYPVDDLRSVGQRIEVLLEASASGGAVQRARAEELVGLVTDLYGAGLERVLTILHESGRLDGEVLRRLVEDDLVSGLMIVHGLHPQSVEERVEAALESVRPYLGSHGGNVELLAVRDDGVVVLRMLGSCDGCPSSSVTLQLAVEGAVEDAAPEITGIEVEAAAAEPVRGLIPVDSLRSRIESPVTDLDVEWVAVPDLARLASGELAGFTIEGIEVVACALDDARLVYRDSCAHCSSTLAGASMSGTGDRIALSCPACQTGFDVRRAGANIAGGPEHLDPLPTLSSEGQWRVAVPVAVTA